MVTEIEFVENTSVYKKNYT